MTFDLQLKLILNESLFFLVQNIHSLFLLRRHFKINVSIYLWLFLQWKRSYKKRRCSIEKCLFLRTKWYFYTASWILNFATKHPLIQWLHVGILRNFHYYWLYYGGQFLLVLWIICSTSESSTNLWQEKYFP